MSTIPQSTDCNILIRENEKLTGIIERSLTEILEISVRGNGKVLGDYIDSNSDLKLDEIEKSVPIILSEHNRGLLFRVIEILNEVNDA